MMMNNKIHITKPKFLWLLIAYFAVLIPVVDAQSRIVGGDDVSNETEFPFYAIPNSGVVCGASLIWGNVLVTAAHCGEKAWTDGVLIGRTTALYNISSSKHYTTQRVVAHPNYHAASVRNDIALIILNDFITDIPYDQVNFDPILPKVSSIMTAIGYGQIKENGSLSSTLQKVDIQIESFRTCVRSFPEIRNKLHLCNRGLPNGGKDTCAGDSGGPLLMKDTSIITGIVSYGNGCGRRRTPGVNVRISSYKTWIQNTICSSNSGQNLPSYCQK
jgi:trypsin